MPGASGNLPRATERGPQTHPTPATTGHRPQGLSALSVSSGRHPMPRQRREADGRPSAGRAHPTRTRINTGPRRGAVAVLVAKGKESRPPHRYAGTSTDGASADSQPLVGCRQTGVGRPSATLKFATLQKSRQKGGDPATPSITATLLHRSPAERSLAPYNRKPPFTKKKTSSLMDRPATHAPSHTRTHGHQQDATPGHGSLAARVPSVAIPADLNLRISVGT